MKNLTLSELKNLENHIPSLAGFPSRILVETYDEFVEVLYKAFDVIVADLEENPELRGGDGEDRLTIEIKSQLRRMGYDANHDSKIGGHTDLSIRRNDFLWIGEAKIDNGPTYLMDGFQQLTTRYAPGTDNRDQGGLLIYLKGKNAKLIMDNWREHLEKQGLLNLQLEKCKNRKLAFFSSHSLDSTSLPFKVRHMPVLLYFNPQDKSGRD